MTRAAGWAATALVTAAAVSAAARPTQAPIVVDGDLADWAVVLASPPNVTRDGDASSLPCADSIDRDCPIGRAGNDLESFAWTWDATSLFVCVRRFGTQGGAEGAWVYVDVDDDGLEEAGEMVVFVDADSGVVDAYAYEPLGPAGDPVTDAGGWADGYTLPGGIASLPSWIDLVPAIDGLSIEAAIPWTELGAPAGSAIGLHVSYSSGLSIPSTITDNAGAPGGRALSTRWRELAIDPAVLEAGAAPLASAWLPFSLRNDGNAPCTPVLSLVASQPAAIALWLDTDADGRGDVRLALDAEGDGRLDGPGDVLDAAGDADLDGRLDAGVLAGSSVVALCVEAAIPEGMSAGALEIALAAEASDDPATRSVATARVHVGTVTIDPDRHVTAVAGGSVRCSHVLRNNGGAAARVDASIVSAFAWPWALWNDANGDGDETGELPLSDSDGDTVADVVLAAGATLPLIVAAAVPAGAASGIVETVAVRAERAGVVESFAVDDVTVGSAVDLSPNHLASQGRELRGPAGGAVYFPHSLRNALPSAETFDLAAVSPDGWPVAFLEDPDHDGRPYDARPMGARTPSIAPNGGAFDFFVRVDIPAGSATATMTRVTTTATSVSRPSESDDAFDEAVSAIVTTWEDAGHAASLRQATPCMTVHALATGLPPSTTGLRFAWRDSRGVATRVQQVASDAAGRAEDSHDLGATEMGALTVEAQLADGTVLDVAPFDAADPVTASGIDMERAELAPSDRLDAGAKLDNTSDLLTATDVTVAWRVLDPARTSYLDASGAFLPWSGSEWTAQSRVAAIGRNQRPRVPLRMDAAFPQLGTYEVQAWTATSCAPLVLRATATFEVLPDGDGDGVTDRAEIAQGTDPADRDTDDDGLEDLADGSADSDGDGVIDALACDADGDGLVDGLEAGVVVAGADTSPAGCFTPDADPSTTTDPHRADTDSGGVNDGDEDASRDGALDAGERDPLDGGDDLAGCAAAAPARIDDVRVTRSASGVQLAWGAQADPCVTYAVLVSRSLPAFAAAASSLSATAWDDAPPPGLVCYHVRADSSLGGPGAL